MLPKSAIARNIVSVVKRAAPWLEPMARHGGPLRAQVVLKNTGWFMAAPAQMGSAGTIETPIERKVYASLGVIGRALIVARRPKP